MIRPTRRRMLALAAGAAALPATARAQGFAGLGTEAGAFALPQRGTRLRFPEDHYPHPGFRIEWWYLTANLRAADGTACGVQWTLFRSALRPRARDDDGTAQTWMAHAALTTPELHRYDERLARGGIGQAGVARPFDAHIDDWSMRSRAEGGADLLSALDLAARGSDFAYALRLDAEGPLVLHGDAGYSVKSPDGQASHYYSQPFYRVSGTLTLPGRAFEVTGHGWLDREWSSQPLAEDQTGWDWFSLSFETGAKLMGFGLRDRDGGHFTSATWIEPDGTTRTYGDGALRLTALDTAEVAGRTVPVTWRVELPAEDLSVETRPVNPGSWMGTLFSYWEGPVLVGGSHDGTGYLEMTGYTPDD
ncbi:lipocalin-like domain-containing protein [Roseivivax isoporae]|uniref:Iron ABC transporter permease n=1 Tax=Roseivivax isoporae LMG 25204 TaxID=1449351 RepID=X7F239_9RHOB|nr:lipocalin-like domain-containing protein [Roseivivax isoporae]ETX26813.1 iron ABC transporter permease [Roseivivax isoporae LMG 25204]